MRIETTKEWLDQRIDSTARRVNRIPNEVRMLAVSKRQNVDAIQHLIASGQQAFGENYLQEALDKITKLADQSLEWHFIGHIQRNKTAAIAENFDWVQSIDRFIIAERLSQQRPRSLGELNICLQVRMSDEAGKGGVSIEELPALADKISLLPGVVLRGLMTIPENTSNNEKQRASFHRMHELFIKLKASHATVDTLSMGMSGDFELAIEEGSTMIRIGTALFGPRN